MRFAESSRTALFIEPFAVSSACRALAVMLLGTAVLLAVAVTLHLVTRR